MTRAAARGGAAAMAEDDLLAGVADALAAGGWLYHHDRRADLALTMGSVGFPDVCAVHPTRGRLLLLELKSAAGRLSPDQARWLDALSAPGLSVGARVVGPADYDALVDELLGDRLLRGAR